MDGALYLHDSYLKSCSSKVVEVKEEKFVILDQTVFYPRGGGQPCDSGKLIRKSDGKEFAVVSVAKSEGKILHEISGSGLPSVGDEVECQIDWVRRYKLMRMHTAGHVLAAIMYKAGMLITGNQIDTDKTRFDFSMENFDKAAFQKLVDDANAQIARNLEVSVSFLPREEAIKIEGAVKLAAALPPDVKELRMVRIGDVDYQADGGTHVKNTSEIGKIVFLGAENKGKNNRRITYALLP
ncbi:MAG: alanyl-tRNA editing protein [Candidatus Anstonellaceae archaeon]